MHANLSEGSALRTSRIRAWFFCVVCACMVSWNVRSLVDVEGDESVVDERKIYQVISELERYQVSVYIAALHETKWFGSEVYRSRVAWDVVLC